MGNWKVTKEIFENLHGRVMQILHCATKFIFLTGSLNENR